MSRGDVMIDLNGLFFNVVQQTQIEGMKGRIENVKFDAQEKAHKVVEQAYAPHVKHLDKLGLICQAMWTLIKEKTDLTDEDLLKMVTELDLKDGKLDGKYTKPPVDCPNCDAKICKKFNRCLFCGEEYTEGSAFDTV
jgi:hypothetical protein